MEFLQNLALNLKATGPAAAIAVWFMFITALGLFGGPNSGVALGILAGAGGVLLVSLISPTKQKT